MSAAAAWIRRQLDRPIGESERRAAFTAISVVLIAAALLLAMTSTGVPASQQPRAPHPPTSTVGPVKGGAAPAEALRAARTFLAGYLAFAYGHGPASAVKDAASGLAAALRRRARLVPPALRRLHPRLVAVRSSTGATIVVTGVVKDSEVVAYPIRVVLAAHGGRYLVTGLAGA
ncbi:MAG: hypothetical protein ABSG93_01310 [Solirubrobacteraceae bacterium]|jgi:hypothetical protein